MAYIRPTGIIQLFKNIRLDNRYMHTIYFANESAQNSWFTSKAIGTLQYNNNSYTRPSRSTLKIKDNAENLLGVTYMRFNNRGNKWYYAFVTGVEYINENTTLISFEIDVMQTWFISNGSVPPCYVERQHVTDDVWTKHLEAEPIGSEVYDMDELTANGMGDVFNEYKWVMQTSEKGGGDGGGKYSGIFAGGSFYAGLNGADIGAKIETALGSWDKNEQKADIVDMYMFPSTMVDSSASGGHKRITVKTPTKYDNYKPKNKKLYTYPYSFLYVTTNNGENASYQWEYFDTTIQGADVDFDMYSCFIGGGEISLSPDNYNGIENDFDDKLVINNFPKISWAYDAYQAWTASGGQTKLNFERDMVQRKGMLATERNVSNAIIDTSQDVLEFMSSAAQTAEGYSNLTPQGTEQMTKGITGMARSTLAASSHIVNALYNDKEIKLELEEATKKIDFQFKDARYIPDKVIGKASPSIAVGQKFLGYRFFHCHVRDNEAVRIDNFLTTYGYSINNVTSVNINSRPYWNFVKTKHCQIVGEMPSTSRSAIGRIFDGGIFFWKNGDNIGNFAVGGVDSYGAINNQ